MCLERSVLRFLFLGAIGAVLTALATRLLDVVFDPHRRDRSERIEMDRPAMPGISVRA
jgi:hypothetical protein